MKFKYFFYSTFLYSFLTFLQPASSFLLLPLILKEFTVADYGLYNLMNNVATIFSIIGAGGVIAGVNTFYYKQKDKSLDIFKSNILVFSIAINVVILIVFFFFGDYLFASIFKNDISFSKYGALSVGTGLLQSIMSIILIFHRNGKKIKVYFFYSIAIFICSLLFQFVFIFYLKMGVYGGLLGRLLAIVLPFLFIIFEVKIKLISWVHLLDCFKVFRFSLSILPTTVLIWIYTFIDKYILEGSLTLSELGQFTFIATIGSLVEMFFLAMGNAVQPVVFEKFAASKNNNQIGNYFWFYVSVTFLFALCILTLVPMVTYLIPNKEYLEKSSFLIYIVLGNFFGAYHSIFKWPLLFFQKNKEINLLNVIVSIVGVITSVVLIHFYGLNGAFLSILTSRLLTLPISYFFSKKLIGKDISVLKMFIIPMITAIILVLIFNYITYINTTPYLFMLTITYVLVQFYLFKKSRIFT
jgi:O-antigen/teichoic acid export membrane protein